MKLKYIIKEILIEEKISNRKKDLLLEELSLIVEKSIIVKDKLLKKLKNINKPFADKLINYLTSDKISDSTNIESIDYTENDDKTITAYFEDKMGNVKGRPYRVGKLLTTLGINLKDFKDYEIEELIAHLKKGTLDDFKLVEGEEILWAYLCDNNDENGSTGSCMSSQSAQDFLSIYTENPDSVKCLVLINPLNNKIRGRALVWHTDDDNFFMDKIYLIDNQYRNLFLQYAEENGYKTRTNSTVTLDNYVFDTYPYVDTFKYLNLDNGVLMTYDNGDDSTVELQQTDGRYTETGVRIEYGSHEGERIHEDDAYYLSYRTPHGYIEGYAHYDDVVNIDGEVYLEDDCVKLYNGEWVFKYSDTDYVEITHGVGEGEYAKFDDVANLDSYFYGDDSYAFFSDCESLYDKKYDGYGLKEDIVELFDEIYGVGEYAFEDDCTEHDLEEYGNVWVLIDDIDELENYK